MTSRCLTCGAEPCRCEHAYSEEPAPNTVLWSRDRARANHTPPPEGKGETAGTEETLPVSEFAADGELKRLWAESLGDQRLRPVDEAVEAFAHVDLNALSDALFTRTDGAPAFTPRAADPVPCPGCDTLCEGCPNA